jgi:inositol oxygenase
LQWCTVGDSFPVGCAFSDKNVFPHFFDANPDRHHPVYSTELGLYEAHCGLDKVKMSFGHDEYLYRVCVLNQCTLPMEALYMLRFHSFYPWHKQGAYRHLTNEQDEKMLEQVLKFNQHDLYSKSKEKQDVAALKPYYQKLIAKYFPPVLNW